MIKLTDAICTADKVLPDWRQSGGDCDARDDAMKNHSRYHNHKIQFIKTAAHAEAATLLINIYNNNC